MAGKLAVITGITGNQGGGVAKAFLDAGYKVRGITRDPSKPSGQKWKDLGAELVPGDFENPDSLKSAFKGANVIFGNTDFWSIFGTESVQKQAAEQGKYAGEIAEEIEFKQGCGMIDAVAEAALDTLDVFVLSTLSATKKWSKGKYQHCHHFDSKARQVEYLFNTPRLAELKKKTSLIQMPFYINNWKTPAAQFMRPTKQSDGTYLLRIPLSPQRKVPMGDVTHVAGPLVLALTKVAPGKQLVASAGMLSMKDWCDKVGQQIGATVKYEAMPREELEEMMPGGIGTELADMLLYYEDFGYDGGDPTAIYPDQLGVDVKYQTTDDYFNEEDFSLITNQ